MLTYKDVETFLTDGLASLGYGGSTPDSGQPGQMPLVDPGPTTPVKEKQSPGTMVFATVGGGSGLTLEQTYDQVFITVRTIGPQQDYDTAERLAYDVDGLFLALNSAAMVGTTRVLFVNRAGGGPQLVDYDESSRYHFQTTYITPASTGL